MASMGRQSQASAECEVDEREALEDAPLEGSLIELVLAEHQARGEAEAAPPTQVDGVVVGRIQSLAPGGEPLLELPEGLGGVLPARSMVAITESHVGREVAVMFEGGDVARPVVLGLMHVPQRFHAEHSLEPQQPSLDARGIAEVAEGDAKARFKEGAESEVEQLVLSAGREIVLRCGPASITLTRTGRILIRGAYVLSRSSGVNRIQGGAVRIN